MAVDRLPPQKDPVFAVLLGLVWPGLGHVYAGRPKKGLFYSALVAGTFAAGLWMTRGRAVDSGEEPLWFVAQALVGAPTFVLDRLTATVEASERVATFDLGMLYTAVAGFLNVIAIADALGWVERQILSRRRLLDEQRRADEALLASTAVAWPSRDEPSAELSSATDPGSSGTVPVESSIHRADAVPGAPLSEPGAEPSPTPEEPS